MTLSKYNLSTLQQRTLESRIRHSTTYQKTHPLFRIQYVSAAFVSSLPLPPRDALGNKNRLRKGQKKNSTSTRRRKTLLRDEHLQLAKITTDKNILTKIYYWHELNWQNLLLKGTDKIYCWYNQSMKKYKISRVNLSSKSTPLSLLLLKLCAIIWKNCACAVLVRM